MSTLTMRWGKRLAQWSLWLLFLALGVAHAGTVTYVYTDPQGTPLAEADVNGNITATYNYTPYGSMAPNMSAPPNGPGYTGHVNDPDTGLVYMQARYYDPAVGRFLSTDPVGPSPGNLFHFSRYDYAANNPIINIDPTGRYNCDTQHEKSGCSMISDARGRIQRARNSYVSRSPQAKALQKTLDTLGSENDGNSVSVIFGKVDDSGSNAETSYDKNAGILIKFDLNALKANFGNNKVEVAASLAHEGQHVVDEINLGRNPMQGEERYQTEFNAFVNQSYINQAFASVSMYRVWDPSWPRFTADQFRVWNAQEEANCDAYGCH